MSVQTSLERPVAPDQLKVTESPVAVSGEAVARALAGIESSTHNYLENSRFPLEEDGLGCMRGIVIVLALNLVILGLGSLGWTLWHLLR